MRERKTDTSPENRSIDRRQYLRLAGAATAATLGGAGVLSSSGSHGTVSAAPIKAGSLNPDDWRLAFEDDFDGSSLDSSQWSVGFGWGDEHGSAEELIVPENVVVENGLLRLRLSDGGNRPHAGAVNTKDKVTFGPGSYAEAVIRAPGADGTITAFWSKPNSEAWPPELDFVEIPDFDGSPTESHHTAHWSDATGSTRGKDDSGRAVSPGGDLSERFHTYGCEWRENRVVWYVEGEEIGRLTDADALNALAAGAPYYMMLNPHCALAGWVDSPSMNGWPKSMDVRRVSLYEYDPGNGEGSGGSGPGGDSWTFAHIPDTQKYVFSEERVQIARSQTEWVAANAQSQNIRFASHVGDVVENGDNRSEYEALSGALDALDGAVPYSIANGNHEWGSYGSGTMGDRDATTFYPEYFGAGRYQGKAWYGGSNADYSHYQIFEAGGREWLHIALEWEAPESRNTLKWAQSVIDSHAGMPTIVSTHEYLTDVPGQEGRKGWIDEPDGDGISGQAIWKRFVSPNNQILAVFCGHEYDGDDPKEAGEYHQISQNEAGNDVFEMLANYQTRPNGGNGWLRLLRFAESDDGSVLRIGAETYSSALDTRQTDEGSQFAVELGIEGRFTSTDDPGNGDESDSKRYLWVRSMDAPAEYRFAVSGSIERVEADGHADANDWVSEDGIRAGGTTYSNGNYGDGDGFWITGEITGFDTEDGLELFVADEPADPDTYGSARAYDVLAIDRHPDSSGRVDYIVETDGRLEKTDEGNASLNSGDRVRGRKASGQVLGGRDAYRVYDGSVLDVSTFGGQVVTALNGQQQDFTDS